MDSISLLFFCLCGAGDDYSPVSQDSRDNYTFRVIDEKPSLHPQPSLDQPRITVENVAANIVDILEMAEKPGEELTRRIDGVVGASGWSEWLAQHVLRTLEQVLKQGREKMGTAMAQAYDEAVAASKQVFPELHNSPEEVAAALLVTVLAIGVLVVLAPYVLELLGFGELGPIEGR